MPESYGFTSITHQMKPFIGDHPPVMGPGTLSGGKHVAGTIVATVTATGVRVQLDPAGADGSEKASGILCVDLDASAGDEPGVFLDHGIGVDMYLTWPEGITSAEKAAAVSDLKSAGIYIQ